jgi:hypothetical protein
MFDDDRKAWRETLKVGDKVAIKQHGFGDPDYWICTIEHITPTRKRFDVKTPYGQTMEFGADGYTKSKERWGTRYYIQPVTEEIRHALRLRNTKYKLEKLLLDDRNRLKALTLDQMERIISVLEEDHAQEDPAADA